MSRLFRRPGATVEMRSHLVKQLFGHVSQSIVGELAVVSLVTLGTRVKELAWVLACSRELRNT